MERTGGAFEGGRNYTRNRPLLVISGSTLTDCLWLQAPLSHLRHLEYVAGEAASELTEDAFSHGGPVADQNGTLVGHTTGVELAGALAEGLGCCAGLETIVLRGGGGDAGPSLATLGKLQAFTCDPKEQSLMTACVWQLRLAIVATICRASRSTAASASTRSLLWRW